VGIAVSFRGTSAATLWSSSAYKIVLSNLLIKTSRKGEIILKGRCQNQRWGAHLCYSAWFISRGSGKHPSSNGTVFIWFECSWPYLGQAFV